MASSPELIEWLKTEKAMTVLPPARMPIAVASTDKLGTVFELLIKHNILSAPVYDQKAGEHVAIVDVMDIVVASMLLDEEKEMGKLIASALLDALKDKSKEAPDVSKLVSQETLFKTVEVRDVANLSERNPFVCVPESASLLDVIHALQREHVHRVGIKGADGKLVNYISESSVLAYITSKKLSELSTKRMEELNIHNILPHPKLIVSVPTSAKAVDAFRQMHRERVSAVPVVDNDNRVVANVSAKDLKLIGSDGHAWQLVHLPVLEYLKAAKELEAKGRLERLKLKFFSSTHVIGFLKEDRFVDVVQRLVDSRVHRVYYTDKSQTLYGIVSIKDILSAIAGGRAGAAKP